MKIAIAGKGGAGKTTIAGTLARQFARGGYEVLALDNDLNPNLSLTVGIPADRMTDLRTLSPDGPGYICILDTEASTEHLKLGTAKHVDALFAVVEPYFKSLESGRRIVALARDLGIARTELLANKVRDGDAEVVQEFAAEHDLPLVGMIAFDACFSHAERAAEAPIDFAPDAAAVAAIGDLARSIVRG